MADRSPVRVVLDSDLRLPLDSRLVATARDVPVWAGVGAYRLSSAATLSHIAAARQLKSAGIILFSYDSLITPPNSTTSLTELGRAAFGAGSY